MPDGVECPQCGSDNIEKRDIVTERGGGTQKIKLNYYCKVCGEIFVE